MLRYECFSSHVTAFSTERGEKFGGVPCSVPDDGNSYSGFNINPYCGDTTEHVSTCRHGLCQALGIADEQLLLPHQIHGVVVANIDTGDALVGADALMTSQHGVCIGVSTADCIPILLHDTRHDAICAVHSGWRGTVQHITAKALEAMARSFGTAREDVVAAIGPGIRLEDFEVGDEVYEAFRDAGFAMHEVACKMSAQKTNGGHSGETREARWHIDLVRAVRSDLAGVPFIHDSTISTYSHPHCFFSARRHGINSGRIFTGIMLSLYAH